MESVKVDDRGPARGFDFRYVYPVRILWPIGAVTADQARQILWNPYPGAHHYTLRIERRNGPATVEGLQTYRLVENIVGTSAELPANEFSLTPAIYDILIWAIDASGEALSSVPGRRGVEIRIVE
jgi:hypothetical protein